MKSTPAVCSWTSTLPTVSPWDLAYRASQISGDRELSRAIQKKEINAILAFDCVSGDPHQVFWRRQAVAFFKKNETFCDTEKLEETSFDTFLRFEKLCRETNEIFLLRRYGSFRFDPYVDSILHAARRKIQRWLGDLPSLSELKFQFGPGASTSCKKLTSARHKLGADVTCSFELYSDLECFHDQTPSWPWTLNDVQAQFGELKFVPKSVTALRSIVIEPLLNTFYQKGIGQYMKGCLKRAGCDLRKDQSRNQDLARLGSITNSLATIDLSSASDSLSYRLVEELLPDDWFRLLCSLRTGVVSYKETTIKLEKFSSMGNAFTFELESLIFYALATSIVDYRLHDAVSVYGDDIIIPSPYYRELKVVLSACGFEINLKKSYSDGPFRESCGKDFLLGENVRPYFLKEEVSAKTLMSLHNFMYRRGENRFASWIEDLIPKSFRTYGPDGFGDGHLLAEVYGQCPLGLRARGYHGLTFSTYALKARRHMKPTKGDEVLPVYSIYVREDPESLPIDHYVVRGSFGVRKIHIYTFA